MGKWKARYELLGEVGLLDRSSAPHSSPGQLDEEMTRHGWFAAPGDPDILFDLPTDERWAASFKSEGIDPRLLASETGVA